MARLVDKTFFFINFINISLDSDAVIPQKAHKSDAGYDLFTRDNIIIAAKGSAIIDTGVHIEIPNGYYGKLESKSGLNIKHDIVCLGGVIDAGYTGSIKVKLYNMGNVDYKFDRGDKCVQLIIIPFYNDFEFNIVEKLDETERGDKGFGSTGR